MKFSDEMIKEFAHYNHWRLNAKLADIKENFEDYFDEEDGASPVSAKTIDNVVELLALCDDNCLSSWNIEPYTNGTIMLVSKNNDSVINIGVSKYSCNMMINGAKIKQNPTDFLSQDVASLIMKYYIFNNYTFEIAVPEKKSKAYVPNIEFDFNISSRYAFVR